MIRVERYRPEHLEGIARLQARLWSKDPELNRRYFDWKYLENPFAGGTAEVYVAMEGDEVVGMRGFMPALWRAGVETAMIRCNGDTTVREDREGRGLSHRMLEAAVLGMRERGEAAILSTSAGAAVYGKFVRAGWHVVSRYTALARPAVPGAAVSGVSTDPQPAAMAAIAARAPDDGRVRLVKDERYFAWRYRNPLARYVFLYLKAAGALQAFAVIKSEGSAQRGHGLIVDWAATSDGALAALLRAVVQHLGSIGLAISGLGLGEKMLAQLGALGFKPVPPGADPFSLVLGGTGLRPIQELSLGGRRLGDAASWDFRQADSDGA